MRKLASIILLLLATLPCVAQHTRPYSSSHSSTSYASRPQPRSGDTHVNGYIKRDGIYVQPHYRTHPNSTQRDNYSTKGNVNPYTGKRGTKTATH